MAMTKTQKEFANSAAARQLFKAWAKEAGEDPNDEAIKDAFFFVCRIMPDDQIFRLCVGIMYAEDATKAARRSAMEILGGHRIEYDPE